MARLRRKLQGRTATTSSSRNPARQRQILPLPDGNFIVHAALGLAGATKRITINGSFLNETLVLNAGGLRIAGQLGDTPINPAKLSISIYVPERGNPEAKLVVANAKSGDMIGLPEGNYHIVSTLLDAAANGSASPTNSVISADLRVQAGKLTDATLRHRAATMTLKLVNSPGGEALANTAFTILTPGGDIIREMIGAFPSATLAEGEYVAIARHNGKTYQTTFKVESATRQRCRSARQGSAAARNSLNARQLGQSPSMGSLAELRRRRPRQGMSSKTRTGHAAVERKTRMGHATRKLKRLS